MVRWPTACVGCGLTQLDLLSRHDYEYKDRTLVGSSYRYGQSYNTYKVTTLKVKTWLCPDCLTRARIRYIFFEILFLINMIASIVVFFVSFGYQLWDIVGFVAFILLSIWAIGSIYIFFMWTIFRWNPSRHYHKVRFIGSRFGFAFTFKNLEYLKYFEKRNQGPIIKHQTWFP